MSFHKNFVNVVLCSHFSYDYFYIYLFILTVIVDLGAWVPETVLRPWSLDYPQLIKNAAAEMKNRGY